MGPIFTGEVRYCELPFTKDPGVLAGASLSSNPAITILLKRGETAVSGVVLGAATDPVRAEPTIVGDSIRFWVLGPAADRYLVRGTATLDNNEIGKARDDLVVE